MSAKFEKMDDNDENMPTQLDGQKVSGCLRTNLKIDLNDADALEVQLLELAHDLVVKSDDPDFQNIGRCLKPLASGLAEALRVHNQSRAKNGVFVNALINFTGMALGMAINACARPGHKQRMADEAVNGIQETLKHSISNSRNSEPDKDDSDSLELLARFIAKKAKGKFDA